MASKHPTVLKELHLMETKRMVVGGHGSDVAMRLAPLVASALALGACRVGSSGSRSVDAGPALGTVPTLTGAVIDRVTPEALRAEAERRLRGNWVVLGAEYPGSHQAWSVSDGTVRIHDGARREEWTEELSVRSPCELVRTRSLGNARTETTNTFVFADDGLHVSSSPTPVGLRRGDQLTVCARGQVYAYDMRTAQCDVWDPTMAAESKSSMELCRIVHGAGSDSFVVSPHGGGVSTTLNIQHDALLPAAPAANLARAAPSWEAAVGEAEAIAR
jgi:hypothetical protein